MSFICHINNYTEYNVEWNVFSAFNPPKCTHLEQWAADCEAPGEQFWGISALLKGLTSVVDTFCQSRDSNPQPWVTLGFKSNALSIRPRLPLPWQPSCEALFVWRPKSVKTIDSTMRLHWAGTRDISIAFYFLSYCLFPFGFSLYNHFLLCVSKLLFVSMCVWQCSFLGLLINYWRLICYLFKFLINYVWI